MAIFAGKQHESYFDVVSNPGFRLFGLTKEDILKVHRAMVAWNTTNVEDVLKPDPPPSPEDFRLRAEVLEYELYLRSLPLEDILQEKHLKFQPWRAAGKLGST